MQITITIIILTAAVGYVCWRSYRTLHGSGHSCAGCEGCQLKNHGCQKQENGHCCTKKCGNYLAK